MARNYSVKPEALLKGDVSRRSAKSDPRLRHRVKLGSWVDPEPRAGEGRDLGQHQPNTTQHW